MGIDWQTTLAQLEARIAAATPTDLPLGEQLRRDLNRTGRTYDQWFTGTMTVLTEGELHRQWRDQAEAALLELDQIARLAEKEAQQANGGSPLITTPTGKVLIAPSTAVRFGPSLNAAETKAVGQLGGLRFEAVQAGALGNAIVVKLATEVTETVFNTPAQTTELVIEEKTFTQTIDGGAPQTVVIAAHTERTTTPASSHTARTERRVLTASLGSYSEQLVYQQPPAGTGPGQLDLFRPVATNGRLVTAEWVSASVPGDGSVSLSGATGGVASVQRRLSQAAALPGVSDSTRRVVQQQPFNVPQEPVFYGPEYFKRVPLLGRGRPAPDYAPTYGSIEQGLLDAIATAKSWLQIA